MGEVHFVDKEHPLSFFGDYRMLGLMHKVVTIVVPGDSHQKFAAWNFVAEKL